MLKQVEKNSVYIKYFKEINELLDEFLNISEDDFKKFNSSMKIGEFFHQSQEMKSCDSKINNLLTSFNNFYQKNKLQNPNNDLLVRQFVCVLILIRPKLRSFYRSQFEHYRFSNYYNMLGHKKLDNKFIDQIKNDLEHSYRSVFDHYLSKGDKKDIIIDCLIKDDVEGLKDYLMQTGNSVNVTIKNDRIRYIGKILNKDPENLLDLSVFYGSLLIFKYCIMNNCIPTTETCKYAIAGGNYEIIHILEQHSLSFDYCQSISIAFHRYELTEWLDLHYKHYSFNSYIALFYLNLKAFIYYNEENQKLMPQFGIDLKPISFSIMWNLTDFLIYTVNKISINQIYHIINEILPLSINYNAINFIIYLVENNFIKPDKTFIHRDTLSHFACRCASLPMVDCFINKFKIDVNSLNRKNQTLMDCAISSDSEEIVMYLYNQPNINDKAKDAAIKWLIETGRISNHPDLFKEISHSKSPPDNFIHDI